jgi:anti-anti-sigma regulatory factor
MIELGLEVELHAEHGAALIHVSGPLTAWNRHHLSRAVLKALTDIPSAVIVDLSEAHLVDRVAAATFVAMRREAAKTGPGVGLLVCGARDQLLVQRIRALDRTQPVYDTVAQAIVGIADGSGVERWLFHRLPPGPQAPIEAGVSIAGACTRWGLSHLAFPARAALFDLYMVARRCPAGPMVMTVHYDAGYLLVSIRMPDAFDEVGACARLRPPAGHHHKAGRTGHLVWIALPTSPHHD